MKEERRKIQKPKMNKKRKFVSAGRQTPLPMVCGWGRGGLMSSPMGAESVRRNWFKSRYLYDYGHHVYTTATADR